MLGKLLKYEIKATARIFLPVYAVLLIYSAIDTIISFLSGNQWRAPEIISMVVYAMILAGVFVMTLIVIIQRFYKNLLTDEGYLMFTLPAKASQHIFSKLLTSMLWSAASGIAAAASILIIGIGKRFSEDFIYEFFRVIKDLFQHFNVSSVFFMLEAVLVFVVGLASSILIIHASIACGHLFNRHRILASLGAFIVLNTVSQILVLIVGIIPGNYINDIFKQVYLLNNADTVVHLVMWFSIIFTAALSAGYFVLTNLILSRKLNLE